MVMGCLYFLHDLLSKSKVITQLGEIIVKTLKKKQKTKDKIFHIPIGHGYIMGRSISLIKEREKCRWWDWGVNLEGDICLRLICSALEWKSIWKERNWRILQNLPQDDASLWASVVGLLGFGQDNVRKTRSMEMILFLYDLPTVFLS